MIKKLLIAILAAAAFTLAAEPVSVEARLTEIPGKMPSNDLYSYVYVFKYKVLRLFPVPWMPRKFWWVSTTR